MARPTKWDEEKCIALAADMRKFFQSALKKFEMDPSCRDIPFISKFCREVGKLTQETLNVKAKEFEELSDALKESKEIQKEILILGGLQSRFHATAFIFTAKNITDMRDMIAQEHSGPNGDALKINVMTYGADDPLLKALAAPSIYAERPREEPPVAEAGQTKTPGEEAKEREILARVEKVQPIEKPRTHQELSGQSEA